MKRFSFTVFSVSFFVVAGLLAAHIGHAGVAYSPDGIFFRVYSPAAWDYDLFPDFEYGQAGNEIKNQDYNVVTSIFKDTTPNDDYAETATLLNFKNCKFGDFLYVTTHGDSGGMAAIYLKTQTAVDAWRNNESDTETRESETVMWDGEFAWYAYAPTPWYSIHWRSVLNQTRAIVILSVCDSGPNITSAIVNPSGGAVSFGYTQGCGLINNLNNNAKLLRRMNGKTDGAMKRKAGEAWGDVSEYQAGFAMYGNPDITLCPARVAYFPSGGVNENQGTGYFQVDTYVHNTIPADEALTFTTSGDVTISSVHWVVGTGGKADRIEFDWNGNGSSWRVDVTAHADKFRSWGDATSTFHKLDGNRVTPNGDNVIWYFKPPSGKFGAAFFEDDFDGEDSKFWDVNNVELSQGLLSVRGSATRPAAIIDNQHVETEFLFDGISAFTMFLQSADTLDHFGLSVNGHDAWIEYTGGGTISKFPIESGLFQPDAFYRLSLEVDESKGNMVVAKDRHRDQILAQRQHEMAHGKTWGFMAFVESGQLKMDEYREVCARTDVTSLTPEISGHLTNVRADTSVIQIRQSFTEDFRDDRSSAYDWYLGDESSHKYNESGYLELASPHLNAPVYNIMSVPYEFQNGKITVDFSLAEFSTSAFEIFFRASPGKHPAMSQSYYLHLFDWKEAGYCGIYKVKNGEHILLRMVENLPSFRREVWHAVELNAQGSAFTFSVDGNEYFNFNDEGIREPGNVAFGVKYGRVYLDNIRIEK